MAVCLCLFFLPLQDIYAQSCGNRQLDPVVAGFLKIIGYKDLSIAELRSLPIEQIKNVPLPIIPYPPSDVMRIKITKDSVRVLVFNALHMPNLPIIIHYHGGGFISPLLPGLEYSLWQDSKT